MSSIKAIHDEIAEDGHPAEAALEFRRAAIRSGIVREISADALDLACSLAWIGKAISRTKAAVRWGIEGVDPNTFDFITATAGSHSLRQQSLNDALAAEALRGRREELIKLRALIGFQNAVVQMKNLTGTSIAHSQLLRLAELNAIAEKLPGPKNIRLKGNSADNVVAFPLRSVKKDQSKKRAH